MYLTRYLPRGMYIGTYWNMSRKSGVPVPWPLRDWEASALGNGVSVGFPWKEGAKLKLKDHKLTIVTRTLRVWPNSRRTQRLMSGLIRFSISPL